MSTDENEAWSNQSRSLFCQPCVLTFHDPARCVITAAVCSDSSFVRPCRPHSIHSTLRRLPRSLTCVVHPPCPLLGGPRVVDPWERTAGGCHSRLSSVGLECSAVSLSPDELRRSTSGRRIHLFSSPSSIASPLPSRWAPIRVSLGSLRSPTAPALHGDGRRVCAPSLCSPRVPSIHRAGRVAARAAHRSS